MHAWGFTISQQLAMFQTLYALLKKVRSAYPRDFFFFWGLYFLNLAWNYKRPFCPWSSSHDRLAKLGVNILVFLGVDLIIFLLKGHILPRHALYLSHTFTTGKSKLSHAVWMFCVRYTIKEIVWIIMLRVPRKGSAWVVDGVQNTFGKEQN